MKIRALMFIVTMLVSFYSFSNARIPSSEPVHAPVPPSRLIINNLDSMIFDLASATITATYVDLPIYIKSDDLINGIDYAMKFNLAKLTYSTTVDLTPNDPTIVSLAFFNPNTLFLKYTSTTQQSPFFAANGTHVTKIRFALSAPCTRLDTSDFTNIAAYLNGTRCGFRKTYLDFSQFLPGAGFTTNPTCLNLNVQFSDTSKVTTGAMSAWLWDFGNGATSTSQNPSTTYTATGNYTTSLIATTAMGCKDTVVTQITVNPVPISSFSYSFDCLKDSVLFTNTSSISSGSIISSLWNFGDGSGTSNLANPAYHYNASGLYTVALTSTSNFSCVTAATLVVTLNNKITADFTITALNHCVGSLISFTDASTYSSPINIWNWNFGDGNTSTQQNPSHTYTTAGTYSINLVSTATDGCNGTVQKSLVIHALPVVQFTTSGTVACAGIAVGFNDLSTTAPNSTYLWHFGDGNSSALQNPLYIYPTGGTYPVKLVVTTPVGCSDSLTKPSLLTIHPSPLTSFSLTSTCVMTSINFVDNTSISSGSISSWSWSFGDSGTSILQNPSNTYSLTGTYTVSLTATSDLGCAGTLTQAIVIGNKPVINFDYTSGVTDCAGQALTFNNLSTPAIGPSYSWSFGDGTGSAVKNPVHTYSLSGSYSIKLVVANPGGCADSLTKPYLLTLPLPAVALFSDTTLANAVVLFNNLSTNAVKVSWDFGDNQTSSTSSPQHTYPDVSTYEVCLTAYNQLDCPNTICKDIYVGLASIVAVPSSFTPNEDNVNDVLRVRGGPFTEMQFRIFNEWGNLLFSSGSQDLGWDGNFNGEAQPVGLYEYSLQGKTQDNKKINLYGAVNLTR
jgi:gliding motility-associated-like protein